MHQDEISIKKRFDIWKPDLKPIININWLYTTHVKAIQIGVMAKPVNYFRSINDEAIKLCRSESGSCHDGTVVYCRQSVNQ